MMGLVGASSESCTVQDAPTLSQKTNRISPGGTKETAIFLLGFGVVIFQLYLHSSSRYVPTYLFEPRWV